MQGGNFWVCPFCAARNKAFTAVCLACGRESRAGARAAAQHNRAPDRVRLTRGARALFAVALASAGLLGFLLVRTFRSPALEAAEASTQDQAPDTGRDLVPPSATMPGAPDSGWPAPAAGASGTGAAPVAASPVMALTQPVPLPPPADIAPAGSVRSYVPSAPRPLTTRRQAYTDSDLRAYVATRGAAAATRDSAYVLALRQRRVDDLRARLADAGSADERATLQGWLDGALRDLERAGK